MSVSTGSINGAEINSFAVNAGGFIEAISARGTAGLDAEAMVTRRVRPGVRGAMELEVVTLTTRRCSVRPSVSMGLDTALRITRRRPVSMHATGALEAAGFVVRRVSMRGHAEFVLGAGLRVRWRDFGQIWPARRILLRPDQRGIVEPVSSRRIEVPADSAMPVAPHRRRAWA